MSISRAAANEIMGKNRHKIQQLLKGRPINLHGRMLRIESDTVLIVVHIGAVLEIPVLSPQLHGNDPMVLPCGMIRAARIAFILRAQLALGIPGLRRSLGRGNCFGIFFRLTQADGNIQIAIFRLRLPAQILLHTVAANVIRILVL